MSSSPSQELEKPGQTQWPAIEKALLSGDLSSLNSQQRIDYYYAVCKSLGLNPLTKPFDYMELDGKLTLYAKKDCADQLRSIRSVDIKIMAREVVDGQIYAVTTQAKLPSGRTDESIGALPLVKEDGTWEPATANRKAFFKKNGKYVPLNPGEKANAVMKAETKSKRRVTLSICGLGLPSEDEIESLAGVRRYNFDPANASAGVPTMQQHVADGEWEDLGKPTSPPPPQGAPPTPAAPAEPQQQQPQYYSDHKPESFSKDPPELQELRGSMGQKSRDERIGVFRALQAELHKYLGVDTGEESYRTVLKKHGTEHPENFSSLQRANACLTDLWHLVKVTKENMTIEEEPAGV